MQLVQPLLTSHVDDLPAEDHAESCTDRCGVPIAWKAYEIYELDLALLRFPQLVPSALFRPSLAASHLCRSTRSQMFGACVLDPS